MTMINLKKFPNSYSIYLIPNIFENQKKKQAKTRMAQKI